MASTQPWLTRHGNAIESALGAVFVGLFVYSVADWLGLFPWERGFQPVRAVALTGGMALMPIASLVRPRSGPAFFVLLAASAALIVTSFFVTH